MSFRGELKFNEPMAKYTSWRVGGPAERFYRPADLQDLVEFFTSLDEAEPVFWFGLGSNLLVRDKGIKGTVIATSGLLNDMKMHGELIRAEAGVACAKVARFAARHNRVDAEFLAGIPGTMGGALAMNAGAFGGETWDVVEKVETLSRQGVHTRLKNEFEIAYRSVKGLHKEWFISAYLKLPQGDGEASKEKIRGLLKKRADTQPTSLPNAGSVFKNPENDHAARLIETCGLKGLHNGGAQVSEKHANFIINKDNATARDIEELIEQVASKVEKETGIQLHPEVRIVGEKD